MTKNKNNNKTKDNQTNTQSSQILTIIEESDIELFHDQYDEPYIQCKLSDRFEYFKIGSTKFKRWISKEYYNKFGKTINSEALNSAINIIAAKACFDGKNYELENRVAERDKDIFYDLGDWTAIKINAHGWNRIQEPPILFKTFSHQKTQAIPIESEDSEINTIFEDLLLLINVKDSKQKLLFLISFHCLFLPNIPKPIFVLHGGQGTAKTTTSKLIKELLDPSQLSTLTIGNSQSEFMQQADHHYLLGLDNLTSLPVWMSDTLCQLVTGAGFSKRRLYTNDDDIIYSFKRCVSLNGINLVPSKPDLLDRCLIFELEPIAKKDRIDEKVFWNGFNEMKPKVLGAIFSTLSKAIKLHSNIYLESRPRMADFAIWGAAIAEALGYSKEEFLEAYDDNIKIQHIEALEANPIARVIMAFMDDKIEWIGPATDLYVELDDIAESLKVDTKNRKYPSDPNWLWRRMKEVRPNLESHGIYIDKDDSNRSTGRRIIIRKEDSKNAVNADMVPEGQHDTNDTSFLDLPEAEQEIRTKKYIDELE